MDLSKFSVGSCWKFVDATPSGYILVFKVIHVLPARYSNKLQATIVAMPIGAHDITFASYHLTQGSVYLEELAYATPITVEHFEMFYNLANHSKEEV